MLHAGRIQFQNRSLDRSNREGLTAATDHRPVVLVVDDERVIADALAAILRSRSFAAMGAYDAESALDLARVIPPELLISDVILPGMNGIDLAIAMKKAVRDCRVLLFSGHAANVDLLASARDAGHDFTILAKPIHPAELLARISELEMRPQPKQQAEVEIRQEETASG